MKMYKILTDTKKAATNYYMLVERKTGNVVEYFDEMREAIWASKFMSSGGAFNGFTPRFICHQCLEEHEDIPPDSVVKQEDIDSTFSRQVLEK